jgi:hypothetical protein
MGRLRILHSHSRWYWGLRLFLVATPAGMPITWALASPKIDERDVLTAIIDRDPHLATDRPGPALDRRQRLRLPSIRNRPGRPRDHASPADAEQRSERGGCVQARQRGR